ncbi:MAG: 2Fe-2S iron-sulfur cluster-binding protein [Pseudomonadota bacterium]|jgi:NADH-quinone oxidoreductase subunit G
MADAVTPKAPEMVTLTIDGKQVQVPKGTNLIEAAKTAGIEVPHYCYHPHLSVAGNCRMCQVSVKGQPKMTIACNTNVAEGMEVATHLTSKDVADSQAAVLEFILINHPLDCTVCDQAGHCKLQDYHFEYNARSSRFLEQKVHKVKALPLGPTVMLDGERCIMCTRCIRFCDEVTKTSELGMLNRGDQSVIAVSPGKELNNPLSGSVVDLCPVGALTHRKWRFNTRIWFTKQTDAICPGCSTGCNVRVAERDGQVVQVKARRNDAVNKEWLCDEGRYGFDRFLPKERVSNVVANREGGAVSATITDVLGALKGCLKTLTVLAGPDLLLEEYYLLRQLLLRAGSVSRAVVAYHGRGLSEVEQILVSPDHSANFRGAQLAGLIGELPESEYQDVLGKIRRKEIEHVLILGDRAIDNRDMDAALVEGIRAAKLSVAVVSDSSSILAGLVTYLVPGRTILEKSGLLVNRNMRLQYTQNVVDLRDGTWPEWRFLGMLAEVAGSKLVSGDLKAMSDRDLTRWYLATDSLVAPQAMTIQGIKNGGVQLQASSKNNGDEPTAASSVGAPSAA